MQLNSRLSLVLFAILAAQPIAATPSAASGNNAVELSPRSGVVGSGVNNGIGLGDILGGAGLFGGDNKGNYGNNYGHGNGGKGRIGYDNGIGKGHGGRKHKFAEKKLKAAKAAKHANEHKDAAKVNAATKFDAAAANEDANYNNAKLLKFKKAKAKAKGFGKGGFDSFGGFDRRDSAGSGVGIGFGGQNYGSGRGGSDYGSGKKGFSGGSHKKEKVEKLAKHLENANKHKAVAKINKDAKVTAAAAHQDAHLDKLAAKKLAAEKKKSGFGNLL
ncbi:hypothetical protein A4X09_0g7371 [Tilletia walkeri]|uniref:Uncharacterized protein n=1 Tax=Tilletia walkeri TaxID=117179 RepID=A0A8X7N213_9BASI|nr:hypothetical protein A4X09_0g7371 [Tilletia walkeri]